MMMITLILSLILSLIVAWFLLKPHLVLSEEETDANGSETGGLLDRKARSLQVLKDLELDYKMAKISEADYKQAKNSISLELSTTLEKLENSGDGQ